MRRTLGDYFTLQRGTTYKSRLLGEPGPILLGLASIARNGGFRHDSLRTYGGDSPEKLVVQPGELYVSLKDVTQSADLLGAVARLPRDQPAGRLTQDTVKLVPKTSELPLDYLYWVMRTPHYRWYCEAHATGTTNLGLARSDFLSYPAPEPTEGQLKLAEALTAIEEKIDLNRRRTDALEAMARALLKSWFIDFDPVRAKAEGRDTGLPPHIADLFPDSFVESKIGEVPEGWSIGRIGDIAKFRRDSVRPSDFAEELFDHFSIPAFDDGRVPVVEPGDSIKSNKYAVRPTDVLVSKLNPRIPRVWLPEVTGDRIAICSTEFLVATATEPFSREYLYCLFSSPQFSSELGTLVTGTSGSHQRVRPAAVLDMETIKPPPAVVKAFTDRLKPVVARVARGRAEEHALAALRDTILPKLLSGTFWVQDI